MIEEIIYSIDLKQYIEEYAVNKENDWILIDILNRCNILLKKEKTKKQYDIISKQGIMLKDLSWEKLHTGHWKDVPMYWRDIYTLSQIYANLSSIIINDNIKECLKEMDMALMMGGPYFKDEILKIISHIEKYNDKLKTEDYNDNDNDNDNGSSGNGDRKRRIKEIELPCRSLKLPRIKIEIENNINIEEFYIKYLKNQKPCIIKGVVDKWPAFEKWRNLTYFEKYSHRTVPIEIGKNYLSNEWSQELMTMSDFIENYIKNSIDKTGYLAQHTLFDQIPELKKDIIIPEYCSLGNLEKINAWFGPMGTVSPLHTDPYYNLLAQVIGKKYIRLYDNEKNMKPFDDMMRSNSSQIDLDDAADFKNIEHLLFYDFILEEGDLLFIPLKWWHYLKSLSTSFSVSFWWSF